VRSRLALLVVLGGTLVAGQAGAGPKSLVTPPLRVFLGSMVKCTALNAGQKPVAVLVEIVAVIDGTTVYVSEDATLEPGTAVEAEVNGFPASFPTYCRATGLSAKTGRLSYVDFSNSLVVTAP
jgi:hypothetical protein